MERLVIAPDFEAWQTQARNAVRRNLPPDQILWAEDDLADLPLPVCEEPPAFFGPVVRVPKRFLILAKTVACHRSGQRWALLYRVLWRLAHDEPHLLELVTDSDIVGLLRMEKQIRRDLHKMRAFVRFREVGLQDGPWFVAWFEPDHRIVEMNARFFVDRFASMRWSILTPEKCAHWDRQSLSFSPGVARAEAPGEDEALELWRVYYGSIFNPARLKLHAMQAEMPKKYWKNLPEARVIPRLISQAPARVDQMMAESAANSAPAPSHTLAQPPAADGIKQLARAAAGCQACPLYREATQTVFGRGPLDAEIVFVGEQPGDLEDRQGKPFVGPAGQVFNRALAAADIPRKTTYVTNTVKHFKWEPRGKRRLHKAPNDRDVASCRPWLEAELALIRPKLIVALGATAAKALLGPQFRVSRQRGVVFSSSFAPRVLATIHPSSLLRLPPGSNSVEEFDRFVADLRAARAAIAQP